MIQSPKLLAAILNVDSEKLLCVSKSLEDEVLIKKFYYTYQKKKSNGKFRTIAPSFKELKDIQNRILSRIFSHVTLPYYVLGGLKNRSGVMNAKFHSGQKFHLQTDLSSFFDFVTHDEIYSALIALNFSADVSKIITTLTTYKGHLPQGAPTSPFLANLVGLAIDKLYIDYCKDNRIIYTRFIDDLTFSSNKDFKEDVQLILDAINEKGYVYNHKKTHYKLGSIQVTGVRTGYHDLTVTDKQLDKILSNKTTDSSRQGLVHYLNYISNVDKTFDVSVFKSAFAALKYPEKIYPYMNYKKPRHSDSNLTSK